MIRFGRRVPIFLAPQPPFTECDLPKCALWQLGLYACGKGAGKTELFGDYSLGDARIRIWTRTAVRKQVTSFGTFLSTLCHEFCHHLDCQKFGFAGSPHTRGFYERAAMLYHHSRGTPVKKLFWIEMPGGRWRVDWRRTNAVQQAADQIARFSSRSYSGK